MQGVWVLECILHIAGFGQGMPRPKSEEQIDDAIIAVWNTPHRGSTPPYQRPETEAKKGTLVGGAFTLDHGSCLAEKNPKTLRFMSDP